MEELKEYVFSLGADLAGFADLSSMPVKNRWNLPYGISFGIAVDPAVLALIPQKATMGYYNVYQGLNRKLDEIAKKLEEYLTGKGYSAIAQTMDFVSKQRKEYYMNETCAAFLPHKTIAALSGLGWIAKNSLLITEKYGSAARISSVLTDAPVAAKKNTYRCLCGDCKICVDACPGNAIKNNTWSTETTRDELFDFNTCRKTIESRGLELGIKNGSCGVCMAVCPFTQKYLKSAIPVV